MWCVARVTCLVICNTPITRIPFLLRLHQLPRLAFDSNFTYETEGPEAG